MAEQRNLPTVVLVIGAVIIVLLALIITIKAVGGKPPADAIIQQTLNLRANPDALTHADAVAKMERIVEQANNDAITDQWSRITDCLSDCPDEAYLDMVLVSAVEYESDYSKSDVLINIVAAHRYWGTEEHVVDFSKAVSMADDQIEALGKKRADKLWDEILECNGCDDMNNMFFDLIHLVTQP